MGRYFYRWEVMYYSGTWLKRKFVEAKTREDAIKKVRAQDDVTEIYRARRTDTW